MRLQVLLFQPNMTIWRRKEILFPVGVLFFINLSHGTVKAAEGCLGTLCGRPSLEPLTREVRILRESTSCTLGNKEVDAIVPGSQNNPTNVKNVEQVLPELKFQEFFPRRNEAYTYRNFLRAMGKYPAICRNSDNCSKILAAMFAHFQQETAGLFFLEEINKENSYCAKWSEWVAEAYPCSQGKKYYGRGSKQLTWNFNYGAFSKAIFGNTSVLLEKPELVATTWLNFASAIWFFVTPQPPKPSMLQVVDGSWRRSSSFAEPIRNNHHLFHPHLAGVGRHLAAQPG